MSQVDVTRDYGETANDKANELLFHLGLATVSIVVLIALAIGWREAVVTLVVIPTTILLTLFAARLMGYTINRVSLFALIFSIGILVDDAIVVVENIARHWAMRDGRPRMQAAIEAVAEVGNPTIVATLTVVAALLPMLFVSGLMGPYMAPIPANASAAMLFSFFVAMVVAPWLMLKLAPGKAHAAQRDAQHDEGRLGRLYRRVAAPIVLRTRARAWMFLLAVGVATIAACALFYTEAVTVKLLPFDNKSELQVVLEPARRQQPGGHRTHAVRRRRHRARSCRRSRRCRPMPAPPRRSISTAWCGTTTCAQSPELGDLQINLRREGDRERSSHDIALDLRQRLAGAGVAGRQHAAGGRGAARARRCWRRCWPRSTAPMPRRAARWRERDEGAVPVGAVHRRCRRFVRACRGRGCAWRSTRTNSSIFGVEQSDVYDTIQALFGGIGGRDIRIAARSAIRSRSASACRSAI